MMRALDKYKISFVVEVEASAHELTPLKTRIAEAVSNLLTMQERDHVGLVIKTRFEVTPIEDQSSVVIPVERNFKNAQ